MSRRPRSTTPLRIARQAVLEEGQNSRENSRNNRVNGGDGNSNAATNSVGSRDGQYNEALAQIEKEPYVFRHWERLVVAADESFEIIIFGKQYTYTQLCAEALRRTKVGIAEEFFAKNTSGGRTGGLTSSSSSRHRDPSSTSSSPPPAPPLPPKGSLPLPDMVDEFSVWFHLITQGFSEAEDVALWEIGIDPLLEKGTSISSTAGGKKPAAAKPSAKKVSTTTTTSTNGAPSLTQEELHQLPAARYVIEARPYAWTIVRCLEYVMTNFVLALDALEEEEEGNDEGQGGGEINSEKKALLEAKKKFISTAGKRYLSSLWALCVQWIWMTDGSLVLNDVPYAAFQCQMRAARLGAPWALVSVGTRLTPGETIEVNGERVSQLGCYAMAGKLKAAQPAGSAGGTNEPFKVLRDAIIVAINKGPKLMELPGYWRELGKSVVVVEGGGSTTDNNSSSSSNNNISLPLFEFNGVEMNGKDCFLKAIELSTDENCISLSQGELIKVMAEGETINMGDVPHVRVGNSLFQHDLNSPLPMGDTMAIRPTATPGASPASLPSSSSSPVPTTSGGGGRRRSSPRAGRRSPTSPVTPATPATPSSTGSARVAELQEEARRKRAESRANQQQQSEGSSRESSTSKLAPVKKKKEGERISSTTTNSAPSEKMTSPAEKSGDGAVVDVPEILMCVVCCANQKNCALMPCHHMATCMECAVGIMGKCPICRNPVTKVIPIYLV